MSTPSTRPLAIVTGASTGIGYHLAELCARNGFDLLVAADEAAIHQAAQDFQALGVSADAVEADLSTTEGVDQLLAATGGRPVGALLANAGRGLGKGFLDQDFDAARKVVDTNITGTIYLLQKVGREMRSRGEGRILITGSIAGFMPGTYQAVYNGTKAFLDSFSFALRHELKDTGVTVTCLMPGATETDFFERADHAGHQGRHGQEGRRRRRGQDRLRRHDGRAGRRGARLDEQAPERDCQHPARRRGRRTAPQDGRTRHGAEVIHPGGQFPAHAGLPAGHPAGGEPFFFAGGANHPGRRLRFSRDMAHSTISSPARSIENAFQAATAGYSDPPQPLGAYLTLMGGFGAFVSGLAGAMWFSRTPLPEKPKLGEILLLGVAAHKLSRLVTKDLVTAPLRAPFVTFKEGAGEGEVEEESRRDGGIKEAVGDLLTCPYCIGVWIITPLWFGMALAPRLTRFIAGILATVTTADFMHRAYLKAKNWGDS